MTYRPGLTWRGFLAGLFLVLACPLQGEEVPARSDPADGDPSQLRPGLSQEDVRKRLGPPRGVARQILYRRYLEQWVYDGPKSCRIEFECVRGKAPQILTIQPLVLSNP